MEKCVSRTSWGTFFLCFIIFEILTFTKLFFRCYISVFPTCLFPSRRPLLAESNQQGADPPILSFIQDLQLLFSVRLASAVLSPLFSLRGSPAVGRGRVAWVGKVVMFHFCWRTDIDALSHPISCPHWSPLSLGLCCTATCRFLTITCVKLLWEYRTVPRFVLNKRPTICPSCSEM